MDRNGSTSTTTPSACGLIGFSVTAPRSVTYTYTMETPPPANPWRFGHKPQEIPLGTHYDRVCQYPWNQVFAYEVGGDRLVVSPFNEKTGIGEPITVQLLDPEDVTAMIVARRLPNLILDRLVAKGLVPHGYTAAGSFQPVAFTQV